MRHKFFVIMNKQSGENNTGIRLRTKANSALLARDSCLLNEIIGGTRHTGSQVRSAPHYKLDLLAGHALHPVTSRACATACVIFVACALPAFVASVTIVISCSCCTWTAKSDNNARLY